MADRPGSVATKFGGRCRAVVATRSKIDAY
jgi:hypothetical protein